VFTPDKLFLTRGCDFKWAYKLVDCDGVATDFPPGRLFYRFDTDPQTLWEYVIEGDVATIKVESEEVDLIPNRMGYKLVFLPDGEDEGGDPVSLGNVQVQK
jgi:hypothetical protein